MAAISPIGGLGSAPLPGLTPTTPSSGIPSSFGRSDFLALPKSYAGFGSGTVGIRNGILSVFAPAERLTGVVQSAQAKPPPIPSPFDIKLPAEKSSDGTDPAQAKAPSNAQDIAQQNQDAGAAIAVRASFQQLKSKIAFARGSGNDDVASALSQTAVSAFGQFQNAPFAGVGTTPPKPFASPPELPKLFVDLGV